MLGSTGPSGCPSRCFLGCSRWGGTPWSGKQPAAKDKPQLACQVPSLGPDALHQAPAKHQHDPDCCLTHLRGLEWVVCEQTRNMREHWRPRTFRTRCTAARSLTRWEMNVDKEHATCMKRLTSGALAAERPDCPRHSLCSAACRTSIGAICWAHDGCLPVEQVVAYRTCAAVCWRVLLEVVQLFHDAF